MTQQSRKESRLKDILNNHHNCCADHRGSCEATEPILETKEVYTAILELVRECVPGDPTHIKLDNYSHREFDGWNACKKQMLENLEKL